jgi:hypothetical protein
MDLRRKLWLRQLSRPFGRMNVVITVGSIYLLQLIVLNVPIRKNTGITERSRKPRPVVADECVPKINLANSK